MSEIIRTHQPGPSVFSEEDLLVIMRALYRYFFSCYHDETAGNTVSPLDSGLREEMGVEVGIAYENTLFVTPELYPAFSAWYRYENYDAWCDCEGRIVPTVAQRAVKCNHIYSCRSYDIMRSIVSQGIDGRIDSYVAYAPKRKFRLKATPTPRSDGGLEFTPDHISDTWVILSASFSRWALSTPEGMISAIAGCLGPFVVFPTPELCAYQNTLGRLGLSYLYEATGATSDAEKYLVCLLYYLYRAQVPSTTIIPSSKIVSKWKDVKHSGEVESLVWPSAEEVLRVKHRIPECEGVLLMELPIEC